MDESERVRGVRAGTPRRMTEPHDLPPYTPDPDTPDPDTPDPDTPDPDTPDPDTPKRLPAVPKLSTVESKAKLPEHWLIAWIPTGRPQQNVGGNEEPVIAVCTSAEFCYADATKWILGSIEQRILRGDGAIMEAEPLARLLEAATEENWKLVVEIYNESSNDGWYMYPSAVGINDGDPNDDLANAIAFAKAEFFPK